MHKLVARSMRAADADFSDSLLVADENDLMGYIVNLELEETYPVFVVSVMVRPGWIHDAKYLQGEEDKVKSLLNRKPRAPKMIDIMLPDDIDPPVFEGDEAVDGLAAANAS